MLALPWYVELFAGIPESFLIVIVGFALFNIRVKLGKAFLIAVISTIASYYVRQIPVIIFGMHSIIGILVLTVLARYLLRSGWGTTLISILSGLVLVYIVQTIVVPIVFTFTGTSINNLESDPWLHVLFFIPQALTLISLYLFMVKKHAYIIDLENEDGYVS